MTNYNTTVTTANDVVTAAYDQRVYDALRPGLHFDSFATFRATRQSHNGATVQFTTAADLAAATTPLSEEVDPDSVAISTDPVTLTLYEYGNSVVTTAKLRGTSFVGFDPIAAQKIGYNAGLTIDTLARTALEATTNTNDVHGGATNLSSDLVRGAFVNLTENNVEPFSDGMYVAFIHPRQAYDLKTETGEDGWRAPQVYAGMSTNVMRGEIGAYEGFRFIVTPRISSTGSGSTGGWKSIFLGQEGLAKGWSLAPEYGPMPKVVLDGTIADKLRRFNPVGWKWLGGYKVFRNEAVYLLTTRATAGV